MERRVQVYLYIAVYLPVKGRIALSNEVCLRSERYQAQECQAAFGAYCLSLQFLRRIVYCRAYPQSAMREKSYAFKASPVVSCREVLSGASYSPRVLL